jgi:membrane protein DedA with SNARE-associated domain
VIAVAAAAAIVGDNLGFWLNRPARRPILDRALRLGRAEYAACPPGAEALITR